MSAPLFQSSITSLPLLSRGKVRDIYAVDADKLLIITSDRLSAFDVVLPDPIPRKGEVLTAVADFWFEKLGHIVPNQLTGIDPESVVAASEREQVRGRSVVARRLRPLPIEAVVRGYVIGSGWNDYRTTGGICGIALPPGLKMAARLPAPIFTPATKAALGDTPLIIKVGYYAPEQQAVLEEVVRDVNPYVAAISAINTLQGTIVDASGEQALPGTGRLKSGVCGAGIKWAGLDMVRRLDALRKREGYGYEIIGVGGVMTPADFAQYRAAGADVVQAVTAPMWNEHLAQDIKAETVLKIV